MIHRTTGLVHNVPIITSLLHERVLILMLALTTQYAIFEKPYNNNSNNLLCLIQFEMDVRPVFQINSNKIKYRLVVKHEMPICPHFKLRYGFSQYTINNI